MKCTCPHCQELGSRLDIFPLGVHSVYTMNSIASLLENLNETDTRTLNLLNDLSDDQLSVPYHCGINPPIWELGHMAFFYDFFLLRHINHQGARMPGYDEVWDSLENYHKYRWEDGHIPNKSITLDYYRSIIDDTREFLLSGNPSPYQLYLCAYSIYHQHMHIESLIYSRQALGYPSPQCTERPPEADKREKHQYLLGDASVPSGDYPIGLPVSEPHIETFCFDNEKPGFTCKLDAFAISKTLVSCGEFLEFVLDGGYTNQDLWSFGGKHWLQENQYQHPPNWKNQDGQWFFRQFDQWHPLQPSYPMLHVSYWEAEAYCQWADRRLPTEYEWEAATRGPEGHLYPWGNAMDTARVDMDGTLMGQIPVDALPEGASPFGCLQMLGTAWEWTSNPYLPYDGFCVDMYPYMSTLQFGTHKTTKGGSCATVSSLIRNTYRQAYFPSRTDVFTGFRTCAL